MTIKLTREGPYAFLVLDRPEALNALSFEIIREIDAAIEQAGSWDIRALIITGAGDKAFCAGADIKELMSRSLTEQKKGAELGQRTFAKLDRLAVPSIAAINGYAFGGGLELALACTFRIAGPGARFGLPEVKLGLIPGYGGTQRLPRLVGEARAMELILTGRTVKPEEAFEMGLVNRLVEGQLRAAATEFADQFASYSKLALGFAREAVQRGRDVPLNEGLCIEADLSTLAYRTEDAEEGMRAFIEKRIPDFKDR